MPAPDSGDDFIRAGGPDEGFGLGIVFFEEAVDRDLQIEDRTEHAALQSPFGEYCEEALDGIEPRARSRREVEGEALVTADRKSVV